MDKIILKNIRLNGIIGVYEWERALPQEIVLTLTLFTDTRRAGQSDNLADCVDYDALARQVRQLAESTGHQTIEALAEDVAALCLAQTGVEKVRVYLEKPGAVTFAESAGVEIERP